MSKPEDFHVGWICALQTEFVAACEMLDEEYADLGTRSLQDNNCYQLGRIGVHRIVIACLPKGKYGTTSAASVARDMLRSFTSIRFGLMVGIGGGAPSPRDDIRLGDVVVSSPSGRAGGVIQYEFGKTVQNQTLERTGSLDAPPAALLTALSLIGTRHERKGNKIDILVANMVNRNPRLRKKYQRPEPETDRLYRSTFIHPDSYQDCGATCSFHTRELIQRAHREDVDDPMVHYGLIASADRLMKDATVRDRLARDEGVLCFEMEAAGLMDHFPCLIIRGICDYSDTHKNETWQGYAAATAAAYAKELLEMIPLTNSSSSTTAAMVECGEVVTRQARGKIEKCGRCSYSCQTNIWIIQAIRASGSVCVSWRVKMNSHVANSASHICKICRQGPFGGDELVSQHLERHTFDEIISAYGENNAVEQYPTVYDGPGTFNSDDQRYKDDDFLY